MAAFSVIVKLQSSRRFGSSSSTQPRSQQPGRENFSLNKLLSGAALVVVWYSDLHANIVIEVSNHLRHKVVSSVFHQD